MLVSNFPPIRDFGRFVDVSGWDASDGGVECPTISGAIAYDQTISGKVYMFVYNQAIHCPILTSHLMCPIQSQMAEVIINDIPKLLEEDPDDKTHAIIVDDPLNLNERLNVPLALKGVTSYFPYRKPKASEYEDEFIPHIDMTSQAPLWEPSETVFAEQ